MSEVIPDIFSSLSGYHLLQISKTKIVKLEDVTV